MTVIVYRDGIMAADSDVFSGDVRCGAAAKVWRTPQGRLLGGAGTFSICNKFRIWGHGTADDPFEPGGDNFSGLFVAPDGVVSRYKPGLTITTAPYHAIGSGEYVAMGALAVGATAEQAVRAAIECNVWCGGEIVMVRL